MSTTEDRPSWINTTGRYSLGPGTNVWTDADGTLNGVARLGDTSITFRSPQQVRDLIAYLAGLAGEMDAEITRHVRELLPQTTLHEPEACSRCGATDTPLVPVNDEGDLRCYESHRCTARAATRDAEAAQAGAR